MGKLSQLSVRKYESQQPVTALTRSPRRFPLSGEAIAQYPGEAIATSPGMGYRYFSKCSDRKVPRGSYRPWASPRVATLCVVIVRAYTMRGL